jgi:ElaB/YqjD/DUF883 family membrane-anchored ribosome-binding protein
MSMRTGSTGRKKTGNDSPLSEFAKRAENFIDGAMDSVSERARNAADYIDERTGAVTLVRKNPLAAVGIAFAAGLAIAAISAPPRDRRWVVERARRQLRATILSGLTAAVAGEVLSFLGDGDGEIAELVKTFTKGVNHDAEEVEYEVDEEFDYDEDDEDEDDIFDA